MLVDDFLVRSASRFSDKTAIICGDRRVTYGEFDETSNRLAQALVDGGVRRGDRVAVFLENSIEAAVSIFGILKSGGVFVVINHTTKPRKLEFILDDCSARALIVGAKYVDSNRAAISGAKSVECVVVCGEATHPKINSRQVVRFERDLSSFQSSHPGRRVIDMDLAALIYTSGSTGSPKGVAVSHLNVISAANSITEYLENVADDVIINMLPLSFDYGLYQLLMSAKVGATLVLEKSFAYPFKIVERIQEERVTGFPGVPTVFAMLLQMGDVEPERFDSVRYVTNTAAALAPAHILRLKGLFRNAKIFSMYGLTECKRVSYLEPEELDRRPASVGKGMPNVHVLVVDEDGNPVPPGVVGELAVRGSNVMVGYWNRPDETATAIRPGRFPWERVLFTGDLFTMDEEGFLYFVSRKDDIIKSRGEKVSPKEVEGIIHELAGIREVVVAGVDDPILGQAVKAFVVRVEGSDVTEKEIIKHCASRLETFMVPRDIEFREALPTTVTGKLRRNALWESTGLPESEGK
jgi:amino acid adenylation domain-containing protein